MSLHAWQTRLSDMLIVRAAGAPVSLDRADRLNPQLSDSERDWLIRIETTPAFKFMCDVQRTWREFRVQTTAPLTLSLLEPARRQEVISAFISRHPTSSIFFVSEAVPFLDVAAEMAADVPHVAELAAFERARLLLGQALGSGDPIEGKGELDPKRKVEVHPLACVVRFRAPADRVIAAAMRGLTPPPVEDRDYWLLIAARLPNLARASKIAEAHLFEVLRKTPAAAETFQGDPPATAAMTTLWQAGALRVAG